MQNKCLVRRRHTTELLIMRRLQEALVIEGGKGFPRFAFGAVPSLETERHVGGGVSLFFLRCHSVFGLQGPILCSEERIINARAYRFRLIKGTPSLPAHDDIRRGIPLCSGVTNAGTSALELGGVQTHPDELQVRIKKKQAYIISSAFP